MTRSADRTPWRPSERDLFWSLTLAWHMTVLVAIAGSARRRAARQADRFAESLAALNRSTDAAGLATGSVRSTINRMAEETSRTQRLAIYWAAGFTLIGAIVGGFAGAIAAHVVG